MLPIFQRPSRAVPPNRPHARRYGPRSLLLSCAILGGLAIEAHADEAHDALIAPYPGTPDIATPFTGIDRYAPVPESAAGPEIDPEKGYAILDFGNGAFFVTEGIYQVMFIQTDDGLILADAPPTIGPRLLAAAEEIAPGAPITHLIYSHAHIDHIGFASEVVAAHPGVEIVAHAETAAELARASDPARPLPDTTFDSVGETFTLTAGGERLDLRYSGPNHQDGNIEIWHETSRTLMLVDVIFPGWMMWRQFAIAEDIPGTFDLVADINTRYDFENLVAGHVARPGTKADVELQLEFMHDLHAAAATALASNTPGDGVPPEDLANPWAVFDRFIDRVVIDCVAALTPDWQDRMAGFEVFIYDQCLAMEQSIRVDGPSIASDG